MWFEFVVGTLPCTEMLFAGYSGFPSSKKPPFPNSNQLQDIHVVDKEPLCGCATVRNIY